MSALLSQKCMTRRCSALPFRGFACVVPAFCGVDCAEEANCRLEPERTSVEAADDRNNT